MMTDAERAKQPLCAVNVACNNDGDEYYAIGYADVTAIEWGWTNGSMAALQTVAVYKNGNLYSEHCFINVLGVHYAAAKGE